jgi:Putative Flp pilus-assembly TadE/G-like
LKRRGQSTLYAVLLMPTLFLIVALAVEVATLELERLRLNYALDLATVTAANAVDPVSYSQTGQLRLNPVAATALTREYLLRNLSGMTDTPHPEEIAAAADITVVNQVPSRDPYRGLLLDRPAVCARIHVLHHFLLLGWIGMNAVELTLSADAEIRT